MVFTVLSFHQNLREAQLFSLVAERRRKFQEIINRSNHEANQAVRPKSSSRWLPPGSPPQMVTEILEIRESMLSLLVKLHQKLSAKQNSLTPSWLEEAESAHHTHGDGITAIERILAKAASRSRHSKRCLQEICGKVCPPVPPKKNSPGDKKSMDKEERCVCVRAKGTVVQLCTMVFNMPGVFRVKTTQVLDIFG